MNRNQRRLGITPKRNNIDCRFKSKTKNDIEEVMAPRTWWSAGRKIAVTNRCSNTSPIQEDFEVEISNSLAPNDAHTQQFETLLIDQYGLGPIIPDTINQLKELRKVLCGNYNKIENSSQSMSPQEKIMVSTCVETSDRAQWQNIDSADEVDKYIRQDKEIMESDTSNLLNIHISEIPRIKVIAEKFSRLKKNNIELRKLEEKVVCVEYDVYKGNNTVKPSQKIRAFFTVKPQNSNEKENDAAFPQGILADLERKFKINSEDLKELNDKEIEIIDDKIAENKPYLDDLKRVLKRKQTILMKRNRTSLDLLSLYTMAKKNSPPLAEDFSHANLLSKAELREIKEHILKSCASSAHGIRRKLKKEKTTVETDDPRNIDVTDSLLSELLKERL